MPNRRITIILNSNQSKRITVLIPVPREHLQSSTTTTTVDTSTNYSVRELILQQARNKFHNRYLDVVYRWGGDVFTDQDVLGLKEEEVLVSMGEAYIGPPKKRTRADGKVGETRVLATESFIHEEAVKQLEKVAELDGVHAAIGMPDLHKGDRFPIGCAIAASGIYPALIGSDIGCGISVYPLGKQPSHLTPEKLASRLKGLDEPWEGNVKEWLALYGITQETEFDAESLGTVGGGNHFAEVVTVEEMVDVEACESMGVVTGNLYLLVHTGSRGLGSSILRHYTKSDPNPYFPPDHTEFEEYLRKHDNAVLWAKANRDLVAHRMRACIFGRRNEEEESEEAAEDAIKENTESQASDPRDALEKILDVTHNSVTPCGYEVDGEMKDVWLHRKGAVPSDRGFVPCPGSRGDFSWILQPAGRGKVNAFSLAHGAGRLHARNAPQLRKGSPSQLTTTPLGSYVVCTDPELLVQERPEAYKGVQTVVDDMESAGIAEGVCKLRPFVTFKTGAEKRK
ncbi:release factor H-coupled R [Serendipita vermifera]|nr:release factor H-coupled R [Serendipita vermifera]